MKLMTTIRVISCLAECAVVMEVMNGSMFDNEVDVILYIGWKLVTNKGKRMVLIT